MNDNKISIEIDETKHSFELPFYLCINACAGSGKTTTIINFLINTIKETRYSINNFLVTTFTHNSAKQLKEKISTALNIECRNSYIGTFHSLSHKILRKSKKELLKGIHVDESIYILYEYLKNNEINIFNNIYFILIDEFQDLNDIQFNIVRLIIKKYPHISLIGVGDVSQNIYTFRGSSIEYIMNFNKYFKDGILIEMNKNYRSNKNIIDVANLIGNKNMVIASKLDKHEPIRVISFNSNYHEMNYIVNEVRKDINNNIPPNQICIMSRNNQILFYYEARLFEMNIKNIIVSDEKIRNNIPIDNVILSTFHGSKGLEYHKVYLIGMSDTFFPHHKDQISIEEERRLCYVAVTRCKNELIISHPHNKTNKLTRFISEIPDKYFIKKNFAIMTNEENENIKVNKISKAVTNLIKNLSGNDYQFLRKEKIITNPDSDINIKVKNIYEPYYYPDFVSRENYYSEFGMFIDYLIRRIIGQSIGNLYDSNANNVLGSLYLEEIEWKQYEKYVMFISTVANELLSVERKEVIEYIKNRVNKYVHQHIKTKKITTEKILSDILIKLVKRSYLFRIKVDEIKIINKKYIPNIFEDILKKAYIKYLDKKNNWKDIIYEIWQVSKVHYLFLDRKRPLYIDIQIAEILECLEFYEKIEKYLKENYLGGGYNIVLNPVFKNGEINGEGDILLEDKEKGEYIIMDIKVSSIEEFNIEHLIQLMVYTHLLREQNKKVNRAIIFNPLLGKEIIIDLENWNKGKELIEYLINIDL